MKIKLTSGFLNTITGELTKKNKCIVLSEEKLRNLIPELNNLGYEVFERKYRSFKNVRLTYHYVLTYGIYKRVSQADFKKICEESLLHQGISEKGYTYYTEYLFLKKK